MFTTTTNEDKAWGRACTSLREINAKFGDAIVNAIDVGEPRPMREILLDISDFKSIRIVQFPKDGPTEFWVLIRSHEYEEGECTAIHDVERLYCGSVTGAMDKLYAPLFVHGVETRIEAAEIALVCARLANDLREAQ